MPVLILTLAVQQGWPPPVRRCRTKSSMTALSGKPTLFVPGYECNTPVAQSRQAILTAIYRYTAVLRPPYGEAHTAVVVKEGRGGVTSACLDFNVSSSSQWRGGGVSSVFVLSSVASPPPYLSMSSPWISLGPVHGQC